MKIYVLPVKNGLWKAVKMTDSRHNWWTRAWQTWYAKIGFRLARSPEMWIEKDIKESIKQCHAK